MKKLNYYVLLASFSLVLSGLAGSAIAGILNFKEPLNTSANSNMDYGAKNQVIKTDLKDLSLSVHETNVLIQQNISGVISTVLKIPLSDEQIASKRNYPDKFFTQFNLKSANSIIVSISMAKKLDKFQLNPNIIVTKSYNCSLSEPECTELSPTVETKISTVLDLNEIPVELKYTYERGHV